VALQNKIDESVEKPRQELPAPQEVKHKIKPAVEQKTTKTKSSQPALYKQAILSGFWTALVILAAIIILIVLS